MTQVLTLRDFSVRSDFIAYAIAPSFLDVDELGLNSSEEGFQLYAEIGLHDERIFYVSFEGEYIDGDVENNNSLVESARPEFDEFVKQWQVTVLI